MAQGWRQDVRLVENGEPVDAGTTNRPGQDLASRTQYLRERLDALDSRSALYDQEAPCDEDVLVGQPVFFNQDTQQYEPAQAVLQTVAGALTLSPLAHCRGLVVAKRSAGICDVLLAGKAPLDISAALLDDAEPAAGNYYLSTRQAGRLVQQEPPLSLPVCYHDGLGNVFMQLTPRNFLDNHAHYKLTLDWRPAGTVAAGAPDEPIDIEDADDSLPGWLPASHVSFGGVAPDGAQYGYNLLAHPELAALWPPAPLSAATLLRTQAVQTDNGYASVGVELPSGADGLVQFTADGIWWRANCYGGTPWPAGYAGSIDSAGSAGSCQPPPDAYGLTLHFSRVLFATDKSVVTSLKIKPGSPLSLVNCQTGDEDTAGDLQLGLDLELLVDEDAAVTGGGVLKALDGTTFQMGNVCEGLLAGDNVQLSGTLSRAVGLQTAHQGLVTISVELDPAERELTPSILRLGDAKERLYADIPYIGFDANRASGVRLQLHVPTAGLPANPQLRLRAILGGSVTADALADLSATYRRLPRAASGQQALPLSDAELPFDTDLAITARNYREIDSDAVPVAAGDTVLITIARAADDGYAGEVMLLRASGVLVPG